MHRYVPRRGARVRRRARERLDPRVRRHARLDRRTRHHDAALSLLRAPRVPTRRPDQASRRTGTASSSARTSSVPPLAAPAMNTAVRTVTGAHGFDSLVQASGDVVVSAVKLADDRSGDLVVRVYEPAGRPRSAGGWRSTGRSNGPVEGHAVEATDPALPGVAAITDGVAAIPSQPRGPHLPLPSPRHGALTGSTETPRRRTSGVPAAGPTAGPPWTAAAPRRRGHHSKRSVMQKTMRSGSWRRSSPWWRRRWCPPPRRQRRACPAARHHNGQGQGHATGTARHGHGHGRPGHARPPDEVRGRRASPTSR